MVDLDALKQALADNAERVAMELLPAGRRNGIHWVVGDITGAPGQSFKVCISGDKSGMCKDFATGEKAVTLLDVCMAVKGCDFTTARNICAGLIGFQVPPSNGNGNGSHARQVPVFDWSKCQGDLTDEALAGFAKWRGFSVEHCQKLKSDGLLGAFDGKIALPVRDQHGATVGAQYFPNGSRGFYTKGTSALPLVVGDIGRAERVFTFESPWDAFAYYEQCGLGLTEAIVSTRGATHAPKLAGRIPEAAELIVFRQNDEPDQSTGKVPDEEWFAKIVEVLERPLKSVRVPAKYKDLNDWTRDGAEMVDIQNAVDGGEPHGVPAGVPLMDLAAVMPDPTKTLLGDRFLCVGGGLLFVGPSGIGKSSASAQQDILWSLGREAFGIRPARPLRVLTVQAENDNGDLGEMARGVIGGLELTDAEKRQVAKNVIYATIDSLSGPLFLAELRKLLRHWKPDILRIDPLFAYLGGDIKDTEITAAFLRQGLNPLLREFNVGVIICHHTPKPAKDTDLWRASDWMYAGAGNADVTNWARAALVIDPTFHASVFKFIAAKRTSRIGWKDEGGQTELSRHFCHASGGTIFWKEAGQDDLNRAADAAADAKKGNKGERNPEGMKNRVKELVPVVGQIRKDLLLHKAQSELGLGVNKARALIGVLIANEEVFEFKIPRSRMRHEVFVTRKAPVTPEDEE